MTCEDFFVKDQDQKLVKLLQIAEMHTIPELGTSVPAFLAKLWKLVEDSDTDDLICWSPVSTFILLFVYNPLIFMCSKCMKF